MLQSDPELFQLYKDLVVSGIVSAEEFWANRVQVRIPFILLLTHNAPALLCVFCSHTSASHNFVEEIETYFTSVTVPAVNRKSNIMSFITYTIYTMYVTWETKR